MTHRLTQTRHRLTWMSEHATSEPGSAADARASRIARLKAAGTPYVVVPGGIEFTEHISGDRGEPGFDRTVRLTWQDINDGPADDDEPCCSDCGAVWDGDADRCHLCGTGNGQ
jgi:hypothetical protein